MPGYNYRAEVSVGTVRLTALLDTGAATNAIPEEIVVDLINEALAAGLDPQDSKWPIVLERWKEGTEIVSGVAMDKCLEILGAVVLPVRFTGIDRREETCRLRFKIFAKRE